MLESLFLGLLLASTHLPHLVTTFEGQAALPSSTSLSLSLP